MIRIMTEFTTREAVIGPSLSLPAAALGFSSVHKVSWKYMTRKDKRQEWKTGVRTSAKDDRGQFLEDGRICRIRFSKEPREGLRFEEKLLRQ
jgi:hypothetical protein